MKRHHILASGFLLGGVLFSSPSLYATEYCSQLANGFADEMAKISSEFKQLKTNAEACKHYRTVLLPADKKILATIQANQNRCDHGGQEVAFAKKELEDDTSLGEKVCSEAGM
jgi:hypothetical protein